MEKGNLIITRTPGTSVRIGTDVLVTFVRMAGNERIKLAIQAPKDMPVVREELISPEVPR